MSNSSQNDHWGSLFSKLEEEKTEKKPSTPSRGKAPSRKKAPVEKAPAETEPVSAPPTSRKKETPPPKAKKKRSGWGVLADELGISGKAGARKAPVSEKEPVSKKEEVIIEREVVEEVVIETAPAPEVPKEPISEIPWPPAAARSKTRKKSSRKVRQAPKPQKVQETRKAEEAVKEPAKEPAEEPVKEPAEAQTQKTSEERPPRRRRRRRRPSRPVEASFIEETQEIDLSVEPEEAVIKEAVEEVVEEAVEVPQPEEVEKTPSVSGRRRRRRRSSRKKVVTTEAVESEVADQETSFGSGLQEEEISAETEGTEEAERGKRRSEKVASAHRDIPSWDEAIEMVISRNLEVREKRPSESRDNGRRGGRRRKSRSK